VKIGFFLYAAILFFGPCLEQVLANPSVVVEKEYFWSSPNLNPVTAKDGVSRRVSKKKSLSLGSLSYKTYFDTYGSPPPFNFLQALKEGGNGLALIQDTHLVFSKTGKRIPLNHSLIPIGANGAPPYLLSVPKGGRVLVVYPYYLLQDKETRYVTEGYSDQGVLLYTFDSLPTHVSSANPYLLVSPERTGCCESLRWSFRFYDLQSGSVTEYGCPEGFCGNVLFTRLGEKGPYFIAQEIVGRVPEVGASVQTNFYVIDPDGKLSSSGKIIYALHEPNIGRNRLETLSPFAISNLVSVAPARQRNSWIIRFGLGKERKILELNSIFRDPAPSVVFWVLKDPSLSGKKKDVKVTDHRLGNLPLLWVSEPGTMIFEISSEDGRKESMTREIQSDTVNIFIF